MPDLNEEQGGKPAALDPNDPLDRIAMEAAGDEAAASQAEQDFLHPPDENAIDPAQTWAQIPLMFGRLISMAMPELHGVYTPDKCLAWGQGMAAVADKYDWDAGATIARFGPEIALCVASVPLVLPTVAAIRARQAAKAEAAEAQQPEKDIDPDTGDVVEQGNPMHQKPGNFSERV
ncbi:hypothetical protein [Janthinobacterium sp. PSPC3-1]|uniref:hypothetical protein n=1 Tax=Janthinobacterium sp. PSPC3-1 TaxID=2804653 RepID=UPI003CEC2912